MKHLLTAEAPTKAVDFLGKKNALKIRKLTGSQVKEFQKFAKTDAEKLPEDERGSHLSHYLVTRAVVDAEDLTTDDLLEFPLDDMNTLVNEILVYSGVINRTEGNA